MDGLVKIGRSSKDPSGDRVRELSRETGVPAPFTVEYQALVENEFAEEAKLHKRFASSRLGSKEFFREEVAAVIAEIRSTCEIKYEDILRVPESDVLKRQEVAEQILAEEAEAQRETKILDERRSELAARRAYEEQRNRENIYDSRRRYVNDHGGLIHYFTSEFRDEGPVRGLMSLIANLLFTTTLCTFFFLSLYSWYRDGFIWFMQIISIVSIVLLWYTLFFLRNKQIWEEAEKRFPLND